MSSDNEFEHTFSTFEQASYLRRVLGAGSVVFLVSAVLLIALPGFFGGILGLTTTETTDWALRMMGAALLALSGQMWLVRSAPELSVRRAAAVMVVAGGAMTLFTVFMPADWTIARFAYLAVGLGFLGAYITLLVKR
jgi:hypothetical protein